jgi:hypothetical protein
MRPTPSTVRPTGLRKFPFWEITVLAPVAGSTAITAPEPFPTKSVTRMVPGTKAAGTGVAAPSRPATDDNTTVTIRPQVMTTSRRDSHCSTVS